jgi:hypothetical protein
MSRIQEYFYNLDFSSNRSIKRKKFDDELVEYSLGLPGLNTIKVSHKVFCILCKHLLSRLSQLQYILQNAKCNIILEAKCKCM